MDQFFYDDFLTFIVNIREPYWLHNNCNNATCIMLYVVCLLSNYTVFIVLYSMYQSIAVFIAVSAVSVLVFFCFHWNSAPCACAVEQSAPSDHLFTWRKWRPVVRTLSYSLSSWAQDNDDGVFLWRRRRLLRWWRILPVLGAFMKAGRNILWSRVVFTVFGVLILSIKKILTGY